MEGAEAQGKEAAPADAAILRDRLGRYRVI